MMEHHSPHKGLTLISGGQTGADRAALDWAIANGIPHGGWCPSDRMAEDGSIDTRYQLTPLETGSYRQRTKRNVQDSDGTLILNIGELSEGTRATVIFAQKLGKPHRVIQLDSLELAREIGEIAGWLCKHGISTLNVAGPRESKRPGIHAQALNFLSRVFGSKT